MRPLVPDVHCGLEAGAIRVSGLEAASLGAPPVEIAVEIAPGRIAVSQFAIDALENEDD
jgi:hypothetical protein